MIGAILGDIVGSRFEFKPHKSEKFEFLTDECRFTDDTVLTVATADAILNQKPEKQCYLKWGNKYPNAGYGERFKRWLETETCPPCNTHGYNSFGNGSAMRVSPVGWLYGNIKSTMNQSTVSAVCTHNHLEGLKGANAVAMCIYLARKGAPKELIKDYISYHFRYNLNRTLDEIRPGYEFDVTCQGSVPEAIICFLESSSIEDAIRKAVSLGGDADTQACIAGSIAEAYYRERMYLNLVLDKTLPKYLPDEMLSIIHKFYRKLQLQGE